MSNKVWDLLSYNQSVEFENATRADWSLDLKEAVKAVEANLKEIEESSIEDSITVKVQ
jgi:hypothetical protein